MATSRALPRAARRARRRRRRRRRRSTELVDARVGDVTADAVAPRRDRRRHRRGAFVVRRAAALGHRRRAAAWAAAAVRGVALVAAARRRAARSPPSSIAAVDALPPADDEPDVDVAAEAAEQRDASGCARSSARTAARCSSGSASSSSTRCSRSPGRSSCSSGLNEGVLEGSRAARCSSRRCSSSSRPRRLAAHVGLHALHGPHRGAAALRAAHPDLLPPAAARARLLRPRDGGPDHDPHDHRRRRVRRTCCRPGSSHALVSLMSFVGVLVVLGILSAGSSRSAVLAIVPPLIIATVWFRRRSARAYAHARDDDLHRERRVPGEHLGRPRRAGVRARGARTSTRSARPPTSYLDARVTTQRLQALYFPFILFLATCARRDRARATAARSCTTAPSPRGTVIAFLLYLDQFFAPIQQLSQVFDQWQQARGVDDEDQRADADAGVPRPTPSDPVEPGRVCAARSASTTCTSRTRTPDARPCTASTSTSRRARRSRSSARPARASRRS